jgi:hypothetical protein
MHKQKLFIYFSLILILSLTLGCGKKSDNAALEVVFCPGIAYSSGADAKSFVYSSINKENGAGSVKLGDDILNGSNILPSKSSNYRFSENRCFLAKEQAITQEFTLIPVVDGEAQSPITKTFSWGSKPEFSQAPRYSISDSGTAFKSIEVVFGGLTGLPADSSVQYRVKLYQFEEGGNLYEMSAQQSSASSAKTTFRGLSGAYPVLEGMIYRDGTPVMAVHYIMPPLS